MAEVATWSLCKLLKNCFVVSFLTPQLKFQPGHSLNFLKIALWAYWLLSWSFDLVTLCRLDADRHRAGCRLSRSLILLYILVYCTFIFYYIVQSAYKLWQWLTPSTLGHFQITTTEMLTRTTSRNSKSTTCTRKFGHNLRRLSTYVVLNILIWKSIKSFHCAFGNLFCSRTSPCP